MTTTRPLIRRGILDQQLWRGAGYFTLTAADVRSLTATTFGQGGDSMAKFHNRYIYTPGSAAGDTQRRVREFDAQKRQLWHEGPDYGIAPAIGAIAEILPYDSEDFNKAVTRALTRRCMLLERTEIVTDGSTVYTIGTAPFDTLTSITDPDDQIFSVEQVYGSNDNFERVEPWDTGGKTYRGEPNNGVLAVRFDPPPQGTIKIIWGKWYTDLTDETTTTTCPLPYATWATVLELFTVLEERTINHAESQAQYATMKASAMDRFMHEHTIALGEYAGRKRRLRRPRTYRPAPAHNLRGQGFGASGGFYR